MTDEQNPVQLNEIRERAKTVAFIRDNEAWAVKISRGQKMPNSYNHPRNNTPEKATKSLRDLEFDDCNIGVHTHGRLVDVDIDVKEEGLLSLLLPALDAYLPPSNHVWGTEKRPRTHRIYQIRGTDDYDPKDFPILRRLQRIPEANVEVRGGPISAGLFSMLPPSVHPTDGYYEWAPKQDPTVSPAVVSVHGLIRGIRLAGAAALLAPLWTEGQRQDMTMALAGFLHRIVEQQEVMGGADEDERLFTLTYEDAERFLSVLLSIADEDSADMHMRKKAFKHTWKKADKGGEVTGASRMAELSGDETLVRKLYTLFTDNPEMQKYQEFEEQFAIWMGKGSIIGMNSVNEGNLENCLMTGEQFRNSFMNKKCLIAGKPVLMTNMLYSSNTVQRLEGFDFDPSDDARILRRPNGAYVNYWTGYDVPPLSSADEVGDDDVQIFLKYMREVVCSDDEDRYKWVMSWCADIFQNPAEKPGTVLVLVGRQGSGKSFLGEQILGPIIGANHYVSPTQVNRIGSRFNKMFGYKLLIQLDEAMNSNQRNQADFIKGMITGKTYQFEMKGHELIEHTAVHRLLFTSNHERNAVPLDGGEEDRRYTIYKVPSKYRRDVEYWETMHSWFGNKTNLAKVHRYLLNYPLDKKLIRYAFNTTEKSETAMSSMEAYDRWLVAILERDHPLSDRTHQKWWHATNFTDTEKNEGKIDRTTWPTFVSPQALAEDYFSSQRSLPNNLKDPVDAATLVQKLVKDNLMDGNFKTRRTVTEYDDRTGTAKTSRQGFRHAPVRHRIEDYLVNRHGQAIMDMVEIANDENGKPEAPTKEVDF